MAECRFRFMGVARIFQRGGHTDSYRGYSSDCHLNIVSCLLTRRLTKGGGSRAPQDPPPGYAYEVSLGVRTCELFLCFVAIVRVSFTSQVSFTGSYTEAEPQIKTF